MSNPISKEAQDQLFREARTFSKWRNQPVDDATLRELYELLKFAPTSANTAPMRVVFVKSRDAKERLSSTLAPGNVEQTMAAPVTAIVAGDRQFHEYIPRLFPQAADYFVNLFTKPGAGELTKAHILRNTTLQGAYLILAARAVGLDAGPMAGFDSTKLDSLFFPDGRYESHLLVNLGYGDTSRLHPRNPRLSFEEVARIE